jgi:hypothetical protein
MVDVLPFCGKCGHPKDKHWGLDKSAQPLCTKCPCGDEFNAGTYRHEFVPVVLKADYDKGVKRLQDSEYQKLRAEFVPQLTWWHKFKDVFCKTYGSVAYMDLVEVVATGEFVGSSWVHEKYPKDKLADYATLQAKVLELRAELEAVKFDLSVAKSAILSYEREVCELKAERDKLKKRA